MHMTVELDNVIGIHHSEGEELMRNVAKTHLWKDLEENDKFYRKPPYILDFNPRHQPPTLFHTQPRLNATSVDNLLSIMATMVTSQPQAKSRRDRDKERKDKTQAQVSAPGDRLKTIVRRLPPNLPEDIFWQSVQAWVTEDTVTWKVYYLGKASKR